MVSTSVNCITERWREYPISIDDYDPMVTDGDAYVLRLKQLEGQLFSKSSKFFVLDNYGEWNGRVMALFVIVDACAEQKPSSPRNHSMRPSFFHKTE